MYKENFYPFFIKNIPKKRNSPFFKAIKQNLLIVREGFDTLESVSWGGEQGLWSGASSNQLGSVGLSGSRFVWFCKRTVPIVGTTEIYKVFVIVHFVLRNTIANTHIGFYTDKQYANYELVSIYTHFTVH